MDAPPRQWTIGRVALVLVIVGLATMWGYVLYLAFGPGRADPLDRIDDPAFAPAAEARCAAALDAVDDLPQAADAADAAGRADVLERANAIFDDMLDDLTSLVPSDDDRQYVEAWLTDWRLYFGDRERYVTALRSNPQARFLVSEKPGEGRHVTGWIDEFAAANRMPSCKAPDDV